MCLCSRCETVEGINESVLRYWKREGIYVEEYFAIKNKITYDDGSVQKVPEIPDELKAIYKNVWEIRQRTLIDMAVARGSYIDQSQSLDIRMDQPNFAKLTSLHFHAWSRGLKIRMYYLRSHAAANAIKFTVDTSMLKQILDIAYVKNVTLAGLKIAAAHFQLRQYRG
ncbi:ribonucleoside-diphosphate reductase large subunit-like isoform X1 [Mangifera indica]|uniref:ribonucleoside-diphosphate reductase large subunit-like isoform X1 n=1 Tax=Mangifera indica TaxID=29780 RepID=UPI001CFA19CB|nr:ribonucleoside-diphosphate reductase large subunit-like isoform X1 [Mangifera indica]XP_044475077.1 ribonucleoside-diphosphate reductase large subunit-like isoform X1 [Mangifera indica]